MVYFSPSHPPTQTRSPRHPPGLPLPRTQVWHASSVQGASPKAPQTPATLTPAPPHSNGQNPNPPTQSHPHTQATKQRGASLFKGQGAFDRNKDHPRVAGQGLVVAPGLLPQGRFPIPPLSSSFGASKTKWGWHRAPWGQQAAARKITRRRTACNKAGPREEAAGRAGAGPHFARAVGTTGRLGTSFVLWKG